MKLKKSIAIVMFCLSIAALYLSTLVAAPITPKSKPMVVERCKNTRGFNYKCDNTRSGICVEIVLCD